VLLVTRDIPGTPEQLVLQEVLVEMILRYRHRPDDKDVEATVDTKEQKVMVNQKK